MTAKRRGANKSSNYVISLKQDTFETDSPYCIGKVRSNFMGTEFYVYDNGKNPKKTKNVDNVRKELALVYYESSFIRGKTPRKMRVYTPELDEAGNILEWRPCNEDERISSFVKQDRLDKIRSYVNKNPRWNPETGAYVLNFRGRVKKASVKNFQLIEEHNGK